MPSEPQASLGEEEEQEQTMLFVPWQKLGSPLTKKASLAWL